MSDGKPDEATLRWRKIEELKETSKRVLSLYKEGGETMPTEYFALGLKFLSSYFATRSLDQIFAKIGHSKGEADIEELVYLLLTESLEKFCNELGFEYDKKAMLETFIYSAKQLDIFRYDSQLKAVLERAIGLELIPEQFDRWVRIVEEHIVSDKYQKLFRAIQFSLMKGSDIAITEPQWMQKYLSGNFCEIPFAKNQQFVAICADIETSLSKKCWQSTQQLLVELMLNALQHGRAKRFYLFIDESKLVLKDDGAEFDTLILAQEQTKLSGGNWTIRNYKKDFPDVKIAYQYANQKNETSLDFGEKVFNVNGFCEIIIPVEDIFFHIDIRLRYPDSRAKYYYVDFSKFQAENFGFCISGVMEFLDELMRFCQALASEVFLYIPNDGNSAWDDLEHMISVCNADRYIFDRIHIIRE